MVATTETLDALKGIGLNLYERRIFVALLAKGVATAAQVSEIAKVPRSRSYDVLQSLAEKGFVMVQPSKPLKYVALKPKEALERTKDIMTKKHGELLKRIDNLKGSKILSELETIFSKGLNLVQPSEMAGTLKGRYIINRQLQSIFKNAKKQINVLTTKEGLNDLYDNHYKSLRKIAKSGVRLKIVAPLKDRDVAKAFAEFAEIRNISISSGRFFTIDNEHLVVALTDDAKTHESQDVAFWANSDHVSRNIMDSYFSQLWTSGSRFGK